MNDHKTPPETHQTLFEFLMFTSIEQSCGLGLSNILHEDPDSAQRKMKAYTVSWTMGAMYVIYEMDASKRTKNYIDSQFSNCITIN